MEPLVVGRRENPFDIGFALTRERGVEVDEIELLEDGIRPFPDLLLHDLTARTEAMEAEESRLLLFPLVNLPHLTTGEKYK